MPARPTPPAPPPDPLWRRVLRGALRAPVAMLVALYFLLDDVVFAAVRPLYARLSQLRLFERISAFIHGLGPYQTLLLFAVPFAALEGPKLFALYLIGTGHFRAGTMLLVASHLASIVIVERLFHVTRDKLLTIRPIAVVYGWGIRLRDWAFGLVRGTAAWRFAVSVMEGLRGVLRTLRPSFEAFKSAVGRLFLRLRSAAGRHR